MQNLYPTIFQHLAGAGLNNEHDGWARIIIEKPFGRDLDSARKLSDLLSQVFTEPQIYRIDHYLGKETVQNLLSFRFANGLFEPTWSNQYIDNIQITVAESLGVEGRGEYYDQAGALRDVAQNHLLQLLALAAMEEPTSLKANDIRTAKVTALQALRIPTAADVVRGQYGEGVMDGQLVTGYLNEAEVDARSKTETYVAVKAWIDNSRWQGVPFYIRTGKRLAARTTEIKVQFKRHPSNLFGKAAHTELPNVLTLRIQPNEGISLRLNVKQPGFKVVLESVDMDFAYRSVFADQVEAYERLLLDAIGGDQTLFLRSDEVEQSWQYMEPILQSATVNPYVYTAGSWGPTEADELLQADGREWL